MAIYIYLPSKMSIHNDIHNICLTLLLEQYKGYPISNIPGR